MAQDHGLDDSQHLNRTMQPRSAAGSIDEPGTDLPAGLHRPANTRTPDAITPSDLSPARDQFLQTMLARGNFGSLREAERWAQGVFDAARHRALESDHAAYTQLMGTVKFGEAPEVQVQEMMWGGNFVERMVSLASYLQTWDKASFYAKVAEEAGSKPGDPQVEPAVEAFFAALKEQLGPEAFHSLPDLGEIQPIWDRA